MTAASAPPAPPALSSPPALHAAADAARAAPLPSEQLLRGQRSVEIHHNGAIYRLQATRQGKLILTK